MALQGELAISGPSRVVYGPGVRDVVADDIACSGARRLLVLASRTLREQTPFIDELIGRLGDRVVLTCSPPAYVPGEAVFEVVEQARTRMIDGILSVGGGSMSDLAKAVAYVLAEDVKDTDELRDRRVILRPDGALEMPPLRGSAPVPHWTLPTTLSAAEFTAGFGITDPSRNVMDGYNHPGLVLRCVGLDAEIAAATPPRLWLSTGIMAVNHCVEGQYSLLAQPFMTALCADGLRRLVAHLPRTATQPDDLDARTQCQIGAWQSGFGIAHGGLGLCHSLCHQLGARYGVPYGVTACVLLPATIEFNLPAAAAALTEVAAALGVRDAVEAPDAMRRFIRRLGLPTRLGDIGLDAAMIDPLITDVVEDVCSQWNPRPVDAEGVRTVLTAALA